MPGSCFSEMQSEPALGFWASWPADPTGLTFCTSEGTLARKSSTSLLSMLYGFRNFLVNLLIPKTESHTNISLTVVPRGCALCFHTNKRPQRRCTPSKKYCLEYCIKYSIIVLLSLFRLDELQHFTYSDSNLVR